MIFINQKKLSPKKEKIFFKKSNLEIDSEFFGFFDQPVEFKKIVILKNAQAEICFQNSLTQVQTDFYLKTNTKLKLVIFLTQDWNSQLNFHLQGKNSQLEIFILASLIKRQNLNFDISVFHESSFSTSNQLIKVIARDKSQFISKNQVLVNQNLQNIKSNQTLKSLLIDTGSRVELKPELKINSKDVECLHGATSGHLNQQEIKFLNSRGLAYKLVEEILIQNFSKEIYNQVPTICKGYLGFKPIFFY